MATVKENLIAAKALIDTPEKLKAIGSVQNACTKVTGDITGGQEFLAIIGEDDGEPLTHSGIMTYVDRAIAAQDGS